MDTTKHAVVGLMLLLKHDQRGQEVADSEHNGAKSFMNYCSFLVLYFFGIKAASINRESIRKTVVHPTRKKVYNHYLPMHFLSKQFLTYFLTYLHLQIAIQ